MKFPNQMLPVGLVAALLLLGCSAANNGLVQNENPAAEATEDAAAMNLGDLKQVKIGGIMWYVDYDAAVKVARQSNKPIWLHFGENPG